ncbi:unnamed protein product [Urochloa humidicola]
MTDRPWRPLLREEADGDALRAPTSIHAALPSLSHLSPLLVTRRSSARRSTLPCDVYGNGDADPAMHSPSTSHAQVSRTLKITGSMPFQQQGQDSGAAVFYEAVAM